MKQVAGLLFIVLLFNVRLCTLSAQENPDTLPTNLQRDIINEFNSFSDLHIGYYGTTQNCLPYNVYGFKYRRCWMLIANQDLNLTFLVINAPRTEGKGVTAGSEYLFLGIGKGHTNSYTKLKKRRRVLKDLELYGFYKFNKAGRKAVKGLLLLDYPVVDSGPPWPLKWLSGKAKELAAPEGVIPEISVEPPPVPEAPALPQAPPVPEAPTAPPVPVK